jgi:hypothetical protein
MALRNRQNFPPNGYSFFQPQTGWSAPPHLSFTDTVNQIIAHRQANPRFGLPTDRGSVEMDLDNYTCTRLREQYGDAAREWVILDSAGGVAPPFFQPRPRQSGVGAAAVGAKTTTLEKAKAGVGLIIEWLGDGLTPVDTKTANDRALICSACEFNREPSGLQAAYEKVADGLKLLMNSKEEMKLATNYDDQLKTCQQCDCSLKLKVWAPMDHVKNHTSEKVMASLPVFCWQLK